MTYTVADTTLRDAMYAMSLAKEFPDAELLDDFVRRYPGHADALTEFAIDLAIDALLHREGDEDLPADPEAVSPVVSRVMSQFQNRLYELRQGQERTIPRARAASAEISNPFASLDRDRFRALASRVHANTALLSKFRDRQIEFATIPPRYLRYVADEMDEPLDVLAAHLSAVSEVARARQFFKADGKPGTVARQTFEEAVRSSGLSEDRQRCLMAFKD